MANLTPIWRRVNYDAQGTNRSDKSISGVQDKYYYHVTPNEFLACGGMQCLAINYDVDDNTDIIYVGVSDATGVKNIIAYKLRTDIRFFEVLWTYSGGLANTIMSPSIFSDGNYLYASGVNDGILKIDAFTGSLASTLTTTNGFLSGVSFCPAQYISGKSFGTPLAYDPDGDLYCAVTERDASSPHHVIIKFSDDIHQWTSGKIVPNNDQYASIRASNIAFNPNSVGSYYELFWAGFTSRNCSDETGNNQYALTKLQTDTGATLSGPVGLSGVPNGLIYREQQAPLSARVYFTMPNGLYAYDAETLTQRAYYDSSSYGTCYGSPSFASDGTIYFRVGRALIAVTDANTSFTLKWVYSLLPVGSFNAAAPIIDGSGKIIVCSDHTGSANVHIFTDNGDDGPELNETEELPYGDSGVFATPSIGNTSVLYIGTYSSTRSQNVLYAYGDANPITTTTTTTPATTTTTTTPTTTTTTTTSLGPTTTTTTTPLFKHSLWIGNTTHSLYRLEYNTESASIEDEESLDSIVNRVLFGVNNNKMYVSTNDNLYKYSVGNYVEGTEVTQLLSEANDDKMIMDFYETSNDSVWSLNAYKGKVIQMDPDDLSQSTECSNFDAPFKIVKSIYHDAYFVAGTHVVWKIADGVTTAIYEINDYSIVDIDVSETGFLCIIINGQSEDIIRVLDTDLYTFLLDERITEGKLRFCEYCNEGKFYILSELNTSGTSYSASHYVFDSNNKVLDKTDSIQDIVLTTTTTTIGEVTTSVEVRFPNGGESFALGESYEIKWLSSKAIDDVVKIELYKGGAFYSEIVSQTPNTGIYEWIVPSNVDEGEDYQIRITWITASVNEEDYDQSADNFSILSSALTTTTTTIPTISQEAIGIDFATESNWVVIVLKSGLVSIFELSSNKTYGLIESGVSNAKCMAVSPIVSGGFTSQTKVRIFVGSQPNWSDLWDSGIIETDLKSMFYGAGNNLEPGGKYYANIQVFCEEYGWGEIQVEPFVMPK